MFKDSLIRRRRPISLNADNGLCISFPAEANSCFASQSLLNTLSQHGAAIGLILRLKELPTRKRNDSHPFTFIRKLLPSFHDQSNFPTRCNYSHSQLVSN